MRLALLPLAPLLVAAAVAPHPIASAHKLPKLANQAEEMRKNCRGRIDTVRQERGLPRLAPDKGSDHDPLLVLAVDRSIDGCEVLVVRNDLDDIRPLPQFSDAPARLRPAH
jgi:hypothetical protein